MSLFLLAWKRSTNACNKITTRIHYHYPNLKWITGFHTNSSCILASVDLHETLPGLWPTVSDGVDIPLVMCPQMLQMAIQGIIWYFHASGNGGAISHLAFNMKCVLNAGTFNLSIWGWYGVCVPSRDSMSCDQFPLRGCCSFESFKLDRKSVV